jgi:Arc/MetJ-type ribon-helix-helix transcriptional regulator
MGKAVKKTISLPADLAEEIEEIAREERKTVSAVIQEALRTTRKERIKRDFYQIQSYWCTKAREKGIFDEDDLERYLKS